MGMVRKSFRAVRKQDGTAVVSKRVVGESVKFRLSKCWNPPVKKHHVLDEEAASALINAATEVI
jgi:hypothetical protein